MNKSTYRFIVVALLAVLVLFIITGQFKIVLQSENDENQEPIDTDTEKLESTPSAPAMLASSIGFEYNSQG
jgi:hypothetical protein